MHFNPLFLVPIIGIAAVIIADLLERIGTVEKLQPMVEDLAQLYEIMANKSSAYIEDMEAQLDDADPATKHRLYYLLSLQYANRGDKKGAARYTELDSKLFEELEKESAAEQAPADNGSSC